MLQMMRNNLILQIFMGLLFGVFLGVALPEIAPHFKILGDFFIAGLRAVAPILVLILVMSAIANQHTKVKGNLHQIILLYLVGTFLAALTAVSVSFIFPVTITFASTEMSMDAPANILDILQNLLFKIVDNPVNAVVTANYIGLLAWGIGLGFAFRHATQTSKAMLQDLAMGIGKIVAWIIRLAPLGILGLVAHTVADTGLSGLKMHINLLCLLVGTMLIVAFIVNPLIAFCITRHNPYPLILRCLRDSGVPAFFTRSSAANIPINLKLCEQLNLHRETYTISIPLGATINMAGAAITITIMTLAAVHSLNISLSFGSALLLSMFAAICACGASGVPGGSLLLIPLACSLFGINHEIAMQVVAIGIVISVAQDSCETALNSSTDVVFTAIANPIFPETTIKPVTSPVIFD